MSATTTRNMRCRVRVASGSLVSDSSVFAVGMIAIMHPHTAASGGKAITMLFAVAAAGGAAALATTSEDAKSPPARSQSAEQRVAPVARPPDRPLILQTGAPACGNVMSKAAVASDCRPRGWSYGLRPDIAEHPRAQWRKAEVDE